jgi:hypothetical protein
MLPDPDLDEDASSIAARKDGGVMRRSEGHAGHRVRGTVMHTLNTRFVEIGEPAIEQFERHGVEVTVEARVREHQSFATIACHGSIEIDPDEEPQVAPYPLRFLPHDGRPDTHRQEVIHTWSRVEPVLESVGGVLRWRFGMFGDDPLWTSTELILQSEGEVFEFAPMPQAVFGDDRAQIEPGGLVKVAELVVGSVTQPLAHEMWREAWNLHNRSPRSSLVVGIAAAEVGFKQLVALLVPEAESLVEHIPSPPLDTMIRRVLPNLPIRSGLSSENLCPKHIRKALIKAVEARNQVVHRGVMPEIHLWRILMDVREFLYLLDWHAGHAWAEALLSDHTRRAMRGF